MTAIRLLPDLAIGDRRKTWATTAHSTITTRSLSVNMDFLYDFISVIILMSEGIETDKRNYCYSYKKTLNKHNFYTDSCRAQLLKDWYLLFAYLWLFWGTSNHYFEDFAPRVPLISELWYRYHRSAMSGTRGAILSVFCKKSIVFYILQCVFRSSYIRLCIWPSIVCLSLIVICSLNCISCFT